MCCNSKGCCKSAGCTASMIAKILVIIGGLNWGLVGAGMLASGTMSWNLVSKLLGAWPMVEAVVYVVVGICAVVMAVGCRCKKCQSGVCEACTTEGHADHKMDSVNAPKV